MYVQNIAVGEYLYFYYYNLSQYIELLLIYCWYDNTAKNSILNCIRDLIKNITHLILINQLLVGKMYSLKNFACYKFFYIHFLLWFLLYGNVKVIEPDFYLNRNTCLFKKKFKIVI